MKKPVISMNWGKLQISQTVVRRLKHILYNFRILRRSHIGANVNLGDDGVVNVSTFELQVRYVSVHFFAGVPREPWA